MSMGYGANYADIVSDKFVEEIVGKQLYKEYEEAVQGSNDTDYPATQCVQECGDFLEPLKTIYDKVCDQFQKKTGLTLSLGFHDSDADGSGYDDVDGLFWEVEGVYTLTKAGKKYQNEIKRAFYVTFG
jgi:hypothetical protein